MLATIAAELAAADPANAARYAANAETSAAALDALEAEIAAALAPYRSRPLIVFHDAYAHFAARFGLTIAGALAETDAADPGAATVRRLTALAAEGGADCAFAEPQHSDGVIRALAADTGLRIGRLDPEGTSLPPGPDLYAHLLRAMAAEIATCLTAP
jgi:zinc transport system substrate-binding protein